ncbi:MAG: hypothetical protein ACTSW5_04705 [Promethearchaeota archaeon]
MLPLTLVVSSTIVTGFHVLSLFPRIFHELFNAVEAFKMLRQLYKRDYENNKNKDTTI